MVLLNFTQLLKIGALLIFSFTYWYSRELISEIVLKYSKSLSSQIFIQIVIY